MEQQNQFDLTPHQLILVQAMGTLENAPKLEELARAAGLSPEETGEALDGLLQRNILKRAVQWDEAIVYMVPDNELAEEVFDTICPVSD